MIVMNVDVKYILRLMDPLTLVIFSLLYYFNLPLKWVNNLRSFQLEVISIWY